MWESLVNHWLEQGHLKRSKAGIKNRAKVTHLHSAVTQLFGTFEEIMTEEAGGVRPSHLDFWKRTHTRRSDDLKGKFTPEAEEIAGRYAAIIESVPLELRPNVEPIDWWLQATIPSGELPKKDRLLMYPHTPVSQLIPKLAQHYRQSYRNGAEGSSSSAGSRHRSTIPDRQFLAIVEGVVGQARAHPELYGQRDLTDPELRTLAVNVLESSGSMGSVTGKALQQFVTEEVIDVVDDILDDIIQKYKRDVLVSN